eukprot:7173631-Prorocentrum_lima.AAC.1
MVWELGRRESSGIIWPHPELAPSKVAKYCHICGSLIGVPMWASGVVGVECDCSVRERKVRFVLHYPPIQQADKVDRVPRKSKYLSFGGFLEIEQAE